MNLYAPKIANIALDALKETGYRLQTAELLAKVQRKDDTLKNLDHKEFRSIMLRLHSCGVVSKFGTSRFEWKTLITEWDRTNPFKKQPGAPSTFDSYTSPKPKVPFGHNAPTPKSYLEEDYTKVDKEKEINPNDIPALGAAIKAIAHLQNQIDVVCEQIKHQAEKRIALEAELTELRQIAGNTVRTIKLEKYDGSVLKLKDKVLPRVYERVLSLAQCRRNILLVGPAGCGKTYLAKLIADSLELDFGSVSCTAGMSETHLLGKVVPDLMKGENVFQGASFLDCYEDGGLYLMDELDAADPNLLLCINTAIANNYCNVPNRRKKPRAVRHKNFVLIATANTFGRGATRQYAGRNQLDEATLDRFRIGIVECNYDSAVELAVCPDIGGKNGKKFVYAEPPNTSHKTIQKLLELEYNLRNTCQYIRYKIEQSGMRRLMSTRFMEDAFVMMHSGKWELKQVLESYFEGWSSEEMAKVA